MSTESQDQALPLIAHLTELRDRLLRAILSVLIIFCGLFYFANDIYSYVSEPLRALLPEGSTMIATEVASPLSHSLQINFSVLNFLAVPYIFYQLWSFIAPGMYRNEKRLAIPLLISSVILFYAGAAFAYYVVFPLVFGFFTSVGPENITIMTDINSYLDFVLKLFFAFGLAFEIPIATVIVIWAGITTPEGLAEKRPYVIVGCFIFGMLLTPPDIISQSLLAIPMWVLFELGIVFGRLVKNQKEQILEEGQ